MLKRAGDTKHPCLSPMLTSNHHVSSLSPLTVALVSFVEEVVKFQNDSVFSNYFEESDSVHRIVRFSKHMYCRTFMALPISINLCKTKIWLALPRSCLKPAWLSEFFKSVTETNLVKKILVKTWLSFNSNRIF